MNNFENAFNGDLLLKQEYEKLINKYNPEILIETGSYEGVTTEYMCSLGLPVITTEINEERYSITKKNLSQYGNCSVLFGDSEIELRKIFNSIKSKKILAFLDAHWFDDRVLQRELELLSELDHAPIIMIHDFMVPGKDFGYDCYGGIVYDYENYKQFFDKVYGAGNYTYRYNEEAVGIRRGVIFLEPININ
jgi:predicted O-methyltransferase YrrM